MKYILTPNSGGKMSYPTDYKALCEHLVKNPHIDVKHYCAEANCHLVFEEANEYKIVFKNSIGNRIFFVPEFLKGKVTYEEDGIHYHSPDGKVIKYLYGKPKEATVSKLPS
jgi:hypothetical protein